MSEFKSLIVFFCLLPYAFGTNYYISSSGSDSNNGLSLNSPLATFAKANTLVIPGDIVYVLDGVYTEAISLTTSGTASSWITYTSYSSPITTVTTQAPSPTSVIPSSTPSNTSIPSTTPTTAIPSTSGLISTDPSLSWSVKITPPVTAWASLQLSASYIIISNFHFMGPNDNISLTDANADYNLPGDGTPYYNTVGILIDGTNINPKGSQPHHIIIMNNNIEKYPGGGIQAIATDNIKIEGNYVGYNAYYSRYAYSGISLFQMRRLNNDFYEVFYNNGFSNIIRNNRVYNNAHYVYWKVTGQLSDGNGIIIDSNLVTRDNPIPTDYTGYTMVENNVAFGNGGSGMHTFNSANVYFRGNTIFNNTNVMTMYGNIFASQSHNVFIQGNIVIAKPGSYINLAVNDLGSTSVAYSYNIYWAFQSSFTVIKSYVLTLAVTDYIMDPLLLATTYDNNLLYTSYLSNSYFKLSKGSPVINLVPCFLLPTVDGNGNNRIVLNNYNKNSKIFCDGGAFVSGVNNTLILSPSNGSFRVKMNSFGQIFMTSLIIISITIFHTTFTH